MSRIFLYEYIPAVEELKMYDELMPIVGYYEACIKELMKPLPYDLDALNNLVDAIERAKMTSGLIALVICLMRPYYLLRSKYFESADAEYKAIMSVDIPANPFNYKMRAINGWAATVLTMILNDLEEYSLLNDIKKLFKMLSRIYTSAKINYASVLHMQGKSDKAIKALKRVVKKQPVGLAYYNIGYIYYTRQEYDLAVEYLEQAVNCKHSHPTAKILLHCIKTQKHMDSFTVAIA